MPIYSYYLSGLPERPRLEFELANDEDAAALSVCVLRDDPHAALVWILEDAEPVAVRVRSEAAEMGVLLTMRG